MGSELSASRSRVVKGKSSELGGLKVAELGMGSRAIHLAEDYFLSARFLKVVWRTKRVGHLRDSEQCRGMLMNVHETSVHEKKVA